MNSKVWKTTSFHVTYSYLIPAHFNDPCWLPLNSYTLSIFLTNISLLKKRYLPLTLPWDTNFSHHIYHFSNKSFPVSFEWNTTSSPNLHPQLAYILALKAPPFVSSFLNVFFIILLVLPPLYPKSTSIILLLHFRSFLSPSTTVRL